jgi:wyosine [tRNA(Phe)-imidazoG37] synthetase (radical SAM superfamily)
VDPLPGKRCTYSCPYCQLGIGEVTIERNPYCKVKMFIAELERVEARYDVITFVPSGEPLLDSKAWECALLARGLTGKQVILITNGSLLFDKEVREDAKVFDVVSLKVDAGEEKVWKKVNAPHPSLSFETVIGGMLKFARSFNGKIVTETMIIAGYNDSEEQLREIASLVAQLKPETAFLMIPTRPPAFPVKPGNLELAFNVFKDVLGDKVIVLNEDPYNFYPDDPEELARIAKVHPVPLEKFKEVPENCYVVRYKNKQFVRCKSPS